MLKWNAEKERGAQDQILERATQSGNKRHTPKKGHSAQYNIGDSIGNPFLLYTTQLRWEIYFFAGVQKIHLSFQNTWVYIYIFPKFEVTLPLPKFEIELGNENWILYLLAKLGKLPKNEPYFGTSRNITMRSFFAMTVQELAPKIEQYFWELTSKF